MANELHHRTEAAVLGCCLLRSDLARRIVQRLQADDFAEGLHRNVYQAIEGVLAERHQPDELTVIQWLSDHGKPLTGQGKANVFSFVEAVPTLTNWATYVRSVEDASTRRSVSAAVHQLGKTVESDTAKAEHLADLVTRFARETAERIRRSEQSDGTTIQDGIDQWAYLDGPDTDAVPFPLAELNQIGGGQRRGQVVATGGYSSDGKSWFGLECVEAACQAGRRTMLVTLEMPTVEVLARLLAMQGHSFTKLLDRTLPFETINADLTRLQEWPLRIFDGTSDAATPNGIIGKIEAAASNGDGYRYVVVDHLHLLDVPAGREGYRLALGEAMRAFKRAAVEYGCTIHLLAQLRRSGGTGKEAHVLPGMTDFRESSAIENIADYGIMVWRDRDDMGRQTSRGLVAAVKVRSGAPIPPVPVRFDPMTYRFVASGMPGVVV